MIFRAICFLTGVAILGLTVNATIAVNGGYTVPQNLVLVGIAAGLAIGAIAVGNAWAHKRRAIALGLIVCLIAGELLVLIMTAERVATAQEKQQAPARALVDQRRMAEKRFADAQDALRNAPTTSTRLQAALAAKQAADRAVVEQASLRDCRANCRELLQAQVDTAAREVAAARAALEQDRASLAAAVASAKTKLAAVPLPPSATPLADRLGISQFYIDLARAFATSLAANGLACFLIALGGHHVPMRADLSVTEPKRHQQRKRPSSTPSEPIDVTPEPVATPINAMDQVDRFASQVFCPDTKGSVRVVEALNIYREWCRHNSETRLSDHEFADAFARLVEQTGLQLENPEDPRILGISFTKQIEAA